MNFESKYFVRFNFSKEQIEKNFAGANRDLEIAERADILDVKFTYAYMTLIKGGIALLGHRQLKTKSIPGHQAKIIEKIAQILNDQDIEILGNTMRQKRNQDFYSGGIEVTEKECKEYLDFVGRVLERIEGFIRCKSHFQVGKPDGIGGTRSQFQKIGSCPRISEASVQCPPTTL